LRTERSSTAPPSDEAGLRFVHQHVALVGQLKEVLER
jgi:hypothetical protein